MTHIVTELRDKLPTELGVCLEPLAVIISNLLVGHLSPTEAEQHLREGRFSLLQQYYAQKPIMIHDKVGGGLIDSVLIRDTGEIIVGDINQVKGAAIGANATAIVIEINVPIPPPFPPPFQNAMRV